MVTTKNKWISGFPKRDGYYWFRYKFKGGKKEYNLCQFYCIHKNNDRKLDIWQGVLTKKTRNCFSYYWIEQLNPKIGDWILSNYNTNNSRKVKFEYFEHFTQKVKYLPNIDFKDIE